MKPASIHTLALASAGLAFAGAAQALTLTIELTDARSTQGSINAALYNSETGWRRIEQAVQVRKVDSAPEKTVLVFNDLPPGRYAFSAYHDENGNGQLDTNLLGMPTERYGFTGSPTMGPPSFGEAAVDVQADTTLRIQLR